MNKLARLTAFLTQQTPKELWQQITTDEPLIKDPHKELLNKCVELIDNDVRTQNNA